MILFSDITFDLKYERWSDKDETEKGMAILPGCSAAANHMFILMHLLSHVIVYLVTAHS